MSMRQGKIELVVGIFTVIGFIFLGVLIFFVTDFYFIRHGRSLDVIFKYVSILDKGAPVRMSGVRVGEVKKLTINYDEKTKEPLIKLTLFVNASVQIREKTQVTIRGTTPLSEPHIEIVNKGEADGPLMPEGTTLYGVDPIPMEKLLIVANDILDEVYNFTVRLNKFFADPVIGESFKGILINMDALSKSLKQITTGKEGNLQDTILKIDQAADNLEFVLQHIRDGQGTVGKVFLQDELYNELLAFVRDLKAHPWKLLAKPKQEKKGFHLF